jgi:hypothetical protein
MAVPVGGRVRLSDEPGFGLGLTMKDIQAMCV